jgi:Tol biopolymer transport system component
MGVKDTSVEVDGIEVRLDNESNYQFGDWEYDPVPAQLNFEEQSIRLQPRLATLLSLFLANQGKVLTREQLVDALWGEKSINEDALSRCVAELRSILGDKSRDPIYIQTLPKKGYRFICAVDIASNQEALTDISETQANTDSSVVLSLENDSNNDSKDSSSIEKDANDEAPKSEASVLAKAPISDDVDWLTQLNQLNKNKHFWLFFGAILLAIGIYQSITAPSKVFNQVAQQAEYLKTSLANSKRLTTDANIEYQPDISRQGDKIAYLIRDKGQLIVRIVDRHTKLLHEIRDDTHHLFSPKFSPDGGSLAIAYLDGKLCDVYLVALPSLQKTRLTSCMAHINSGIFDWSADGRYLAYVAPSEKVDKNPLSLAQEKLAAIWIFDTKTERVQQLTRSKIKQEFDSRPVFSPDGSALAFTRGTHSVRNIYTIALPRSLNNLPNTIHEALSFTQDNGFIVSLAWLNNGQQIIFDSNKLGDRALWMLDIITKEQTILGARDAQHPSIDTANHWLVYKEVQYQANIWSAHLSLDGSSQPQGAVSHPSSSDSLPEFEPFIGAIKYNNHPKYAPDGKTVAFVSNRKGKSSLWLYSIADQSQRELLRLPGADIITPNWSKDGDTVLISTREKAGYRCYRLEVSTGIYRQVSASKQALHGCSFDQNGNILAVDKSPGRPNILMVIDPTGQARALTDFAISRAYPLNDDQIVFSKPEQDGLFIINIASKQVKHILPEFNIRMDEQWLVRDHYIYYAEYIDANNKGVWRYNLNTHNRVKLVNDIPSAIGLSLEVSPDHQQLLMVKTDSKLGNLYLSEIKAGI